MERLGFQVKFGHPFPPKQGASQLDLLHQKENNDENRQIKAAASKTRLRPQKQGCGLKNLGILHNPIFPGPDLIFISDDL